MRSLQGYGACACVDWGILCRVTLYNRIQLLTVSHIRDVLIEHSKGLATSKLRYIASLFRATAMAASDAAGGSAAKGLAAEPWLVIPECIVGKRFAAVVGDADE